MAAAPALVFEKRGIQYWMDRAVREYDRVGSEFAADPVHDLRVALRRCRAIAGGVRAIDPDTRWRKMRRAAKGLFASLGELRDVQVLADWVQRLGGEHDPVKDRLASYCAQRERELKIEAKAAFTHFDRDAWLRCARGLDSRTREFSLASEVFQVIALERLERAIDLQRAAMKTRSKAGLHAVRIGIKRLRYIVENFLPEHDQRWSTDLKELQDVLGEIHDLDVLWGTALRIRSFATPQERESWRDAIAREREQRIAIYKAKLVGRNSLFCHWRNELPSGDRLRQGILKKFEVWAGFLDRDPAHSQRVWRRSLEVYDDLLSLGVMRSRSVDAVDARDLLSIAAVSHEVGRAKGKKGSRKRTAQLLEKLDVPPGWEPQHLHLVAFVARYSRGALPFEQPAFRRLARAKREVVALLGGILRLAEALDRGSQDGSQRATLERNNGFLALRAEGYRQLERIAGACLLLETACDIPILVRT
jgi:CHAD domain-containing protein